MIDKPRRPHPTHATGAPVSDNVNVQTAGPRGPALLQDIWLLEKLANIHREVIPATPSVISSASMSTISLSRRRSAHSTPIIATARRVPMATWAARRLNSRIALTNGLISQTSTNRRFRLPAPPPVGTVASTMTTISSLAAYFAK